MISSGWCTVQGCPGRPYDAYFRFPMDKVIYEKWIKVCKSPKSKKPIAWVISSRVCSLHFTHDDYETEDDPVGNLTLESPKPNANPSIFPWTESWPFNKKKKKTVEGVNQKKPLESPKKADALATDQTIHFSRDHGGSATDEGGSSPVLKKRTRASLGAGTTAAHRASSFQKVFTEKRARQKESGSSGTSTGSVLLYDSYSDNINGSTSGTGSSSSDSSTHKSASSTASGTPPDDAAIISASLLGMELNQSSTVKREVDPAPVVLDLSSSSDQENGDEVIETSETVVKKEVEVGEGKRKDRKIIWVVSGTADD